MKRVQNESLANDLTQQTFIKAMLNISKYEDRGFPFGAWIYRIALNETNMHFRKANKNFQVEINEGQINSVLSEIDETSKFGVEQQEELIVILNSLKDDEVDLIDLRFFQKASFKEIANFYAITEANAKMKLYRLIEKIRKQIGQ